MHVEHVVRGQAADVLTLLSHWAQNQALKCRQTHFIFPVSSEPNVKVTRPVNCD